MFLNSHALLCLCPTIVKVHLSNLRIVGSLNLERGFIPLVARLRPKPEHCVFLQKLKETHRLRGAFAADEDWACRIMAWQEDSGSEQNRFLKLSCI